MVHSEETIKASLSSATTVEMISLFKNNPNIVDTVEGVALRMGITKDKIETDISNLTKLGVLKTKYIGKTPVLFVDKKRAEEIVSLTNKTLFSGKIQS